MLIALNHCVAVVLWARTAPGTGRGDGTHANAKVTAWSSNGAVMPTGTFEPAGGATSRRSHRVASIMLTSAEVGRY
jgi:hypothetical protein